jgi:Tol biopolymer transport system component
MALVLRRLDFASAAAASPEHGRAARAHGRPSRTPRPGRILAALAFASSAAAAERPVLPIPGLGEAAEMYFSPDGRFLVGNAKREGDAAHHVYIASVDGKVVRRINDTGEDACSFFFPDGKRIVWTSTRDWPELPKGNWSDPLNYPKGAELYVSDLEGKNLKRLTRNQHYEAEVSVSPDGKWILFGREIDGRMDLWLMDAAGSNETRVTKTDDWQEGGAQFLPDGETILYRAWKREDQGKARAMPMQIFTVKRDGSGVRQVTSGPGTHWAPFPAPDGKRFAYVKVLEGGSGRPNWEIFMMDLETGFETRLTENERFDGFPAISPDGRWLTFSSGREAKPGERTLRQFLMDIGSLGIVPAKAKAR